MNKITNLSFKELARVIILTLVVTLFTGYVLADWQAPPSGSPPTNCNDPDGAGPLTVPDGCHTPINSSSADQLKTGQLTVAGNLFVSHPTTPPDLLVGGKVGIGPTFFSGGPGSTPTEALDIDGQIRIRDGVTGSGKILVSDANGVGSWQDPPNSGISALQAGLGVTFSISSTENVDSLTGSSGYISIYEPETQRRVNGNCLSNTYSAVSSTTQAGGVTCRNFLTQVTGGAGLTNTTPSGGAVTLNANLGSGLIFEGDSISVNIATSTTGDGLRFDNGKVAFEACGTDQTWQWVSGAWTCANFPTPPTANALPGDSVLYLRRKSSLAVPDCPSCSGWTRFPLVTASPNYFSENVGHASNFNNTVIYYNTTASCQVLQYKATSTAALASCPAGSWATAPGDSSCTGGSNCNSEWANGGTLTNYVRTCYLCH